MKKRGWSISVFVLSLVALFLLSIINVSADSNICSSSSQVIVRLNQSAGAVGSLWNSTISGMRDVQNCGNGTFLMGTDTSGKGEPDAWSDWSGSTCAVAVGDAVDGSYNPQTPQSDKAARTLAEYYVSKNAGWIVRINAVNISLGNYCNMVGESPYRTYNVSYEYCIGSYCGNSSTIMNYDYHDGKDAECWDNACTVSWSDGKQDSEETSGQLSNCENLAVNHDLFNKVGNLSNVQRTALATKITNCNIDKAGWDTENVTYNYCLKTQEEYSYQYNYSICYDQLFGMNFSGNPRLCSADNKVVGLSADSNALGSIPSANSDVDICYGNLKCEVKNATDSCSSGYSFVVGLSNQTNATLFASSGNGVNYQICCKAIRIELNRTYWGNMIGQEITQADLNDRVKLIVSGTELNESEINYTIYQSVPFWFDKKVAQTSALGFTTWKANVSGTFYFKAKVEGGQELQSGNLVVSDAENNAPPVVNILSPKLKDIYNVNQAVSFVQNSYDVDDDFTTLWDFGDNVVSSVYNIGHNYSTTGQKNILLNATDERGAIGRNRTAILVIDKSIDGKYVFAHISQPPWGDVIDGQIVDFDAQESFAISYNQTESSNIVCKAGKCPLSTASGENLTNVPQGYDNLYFNWTILPDGLVLENYSLVNMTLSFSYPGPRTTVLKVRFNPEATTSTDYTVNFGAPRCLQIGEDSFWFEDSRASNSFNSCQRANGEPTNFCCPSGYQCSQGGNSWSCIPSDVVTCFDYKTQSSCENYNPAVAKDDIKQRTGKSCDGLIDNGYKIINCQCFWNITLEDGPGCDSSFDKQRIISAQPTVAPEIAGTCTFSDAGSTNCTDGRSFQKWTALWSGNTDTKPVSCISGEKIILCKSPVELPFFGKAEVIVAVLLLILIYLYLIRRGGRHQPRSNKKRL